MKVLYDYQIFCSQRFGGISRYFFELANNLAVAEHGIVKCRIKSPIYINEYLRHAAPELKIKGVFAPALQCTGRVYGMLNRLFSHSALSKWRPDIVHETYYSQSSIAPRHSRILLTVYDMIHEIYPEHFASQDTTSEKKRAAVARADHIICISENTRQELIRLLDVPPEKTSVVHLGFALTRAGAANLPAPRRPFLLYVGARGGYKNFHRLLTAYASRSELRNEYDLVAFGGGIFNARELMLIRSLELNDKQVRQTSGDDSLLSSLYKQAAMFVYPSLHEGFGIPPLEAMNFDCPVACSNTSSIPEVVGDAAVLFDPQQVDSIADALVGLATDRALQATLKRRGRTRTDLFSWRKCAMQTLDVYRQVLG